MEIGEIVWIFHPHAPVSEAKLVSICLKLPVQSSMMAAIRGELERHSVEGLIPGHWSEIQRAWFINPDAWTCIHSMLQKMGIKLSNLEPYMVLNSIHHSTDVLQCRRHPETYVLWLCEVWEEVLNRYAEREVRSVQDQAWLAEHRSKLNELRQKWYQRTLKLAEPVVNQPEAEATPISNSAPITPAATAPEGWLDDIEDEINRIYRRVNQKD